MLALSRSVYDAIIDHARAGTPEEVCGILAGTVGETERHATAVHRTENVADEPRRAYAIGPEQQHEVMTTIEDAGEDIVGFYHSHPQGPPRPSETDRAQATWEGYPYVIVALGGRHPYVGSWHWTGEEFRGERIAISTPER